MKKASLLVAALILTPAAISSRTTALANPPEDANPLFAPFYRALKSPSTGGNCCSEADCRPVEARTFDNVHWEVFIDKKSFGALAPDQWLPVPDAIVIHRPPMELPRPQDPVACFYNGKLLCFTEPAFGG